MLKDFGTLKPLIHKTAFVAENSTVIGDVEMRENSSLWFGCVARGDCGKIIIGKNSNVQDNSVIHGDDREGVNKGVTIGDNVSAGHRVILHGTTIGSNCLIGMGAILLSGSIVGDNCIIGAGAVVTEGQVIPSNSVVMGLPAKVVRSIKTEELARVKLNWTRYVELKNSYLKA